MDQAEWLPVVHDAALVESGCGKVAFFLRRKEWAAGDMISGADVRWPDRSASRDGEPMHCGACGTEMHWSQFTALAAHAAGVA